MIFLHAYVNDSIFSKTNKNVEIDNLLVTYYLININLNKLNISFGLLVISSFYSPIILI